MGELEERMIKWKDLGTIDGITGTAFSDNTIVIEDEAGCGVTIKAANLLFFLQEYQKHYPIIAQIEPGSWKGIEGRSADV